MFVLLLLYKYSIAATAVGVVVVAVEVVVVVVAPPAHTLTGRRGRLRAGAAVEAVRVPEISPLPYNNDFLALYHNNSPWKIPRDSRIMPSGP